MSNLLKEQIVLCQETQARVIDSNELLEEKIASFEQKYYRNRHSEREEATSEEMSSEEAFSQLDESLEEDMIPQMSPEEVQQEADDIIELAKQEAEQVQTVASDEAKRIIDEASAQAEQMLVRATEEGRQNGYNTGMAQAQEQIKQQQEELHQREVQLEQDYNLRQQRMERELTEVIGEVFSHVFAAQLSGKEQILLHLITRALSGAQASRQYMIRVSEDNKPMLSDNRDMLQEQLGQEAHIDIISDPLMGADECIIETDGGIFDCSLDAQLDNLVRDLKSLNDEG